MSERPILFSTPMIQAILAGKKTQTRRLNGLEIINHNRNWISYQRVISANEQTIAQFRHAKLNSPCDVKFPYGNVGDKLWVRETWYQGIGCDKVLLGYKADGDYPHDVTYMVKPSIFLPRKYSRITLEITEIRVQRLNEISPNDCRDEGVEPFLYTINYRKLWDKINGKKYPWESNPYVWCISFKKVN